MKVSQKGLYALEAMTMLARHYQQGAVKIRDIAAEEQLPEKFLEIILIELKNARLVESTRGARGGYQLRRDPSEIRLGEIIRLIDGPLAPFGDADQLRDLMQKDPQHRALYKVFLDVRNAVAGVLDNTTVSDIAGLAASPSSREQPRKRKAGQETAPPRSGRPESEEGRSRLLTLAGP
jgi:Rrf2 family protein